MEGLQYLDERKLVWEALSELYLDTELQDSDFQYVIRILVKSPFTFEEIKKIDQYEVFPVLFSNLLIPAGEWAGFDGKRLAKNIMNWIGSRSQLDIFAIKCIYVLYEPINKAYWEKLEEMYNQTDISDSH
ncbi:DUF7079 family protein [Chryseobacterium paridis]|uniref:DUF7079 domain-containing protein n=1 Tax=Chryseobacterium paridis TaxID=2800328 RepID=A0ABS1FQ45_9FLAO|nr:hypothetical protein [Chryseobacterium paridis]MBK1894540.1 hypothetical protein [Chryseobacterium paridis]